ncbi:CapA family protein [Paracoccus sp. WLY502]|uniref:CapA family protein n=1 Tax=Paracoccus yibinensis TaxID=3068891 RepID=UPI0027969EB3|nr:CapA family protein [Paracoccus sp. WLY502]MDQ1901617.1 CapA family protein [Paracoccus sp. WLY502]
MEIRLDAGHAAGLPPEWWQKVTQGLPILPPAVLDFPDWQLAREAQAPIPIVTAIELFALLLQRSMGWPVTFMASSQAAIRSDQRSGASPAQPTDERLVAVFETRQKAAGLLAGRLALDLCDRLVRAAEDTIDAILAEAFDTFRRRTAATTPHRFALWMASRAMRRGIPWTALPGQAFLRLGRGRQAELLRGLDTSLTPCIAAGFAKRKEIASGLLRAAGLPIAEQRYARSLARAIAGAHEIGFPVVVKPRDGNGGQGVSVDLKTDEEVARAFEVAARISPAVVIESMIKGPTFRLTVIGGRLFGVVERHPPRVRGDGSRTVAELIAEENRNPERQPIYIASMKPIILDEEMLELLAEQGLSPQDVPEAGRWVLLRRVPNPPYGDKTDVTDLVHPTVRAMAERVAAVMGIHVLAIDFVATDISRPYQETGGAICEVNTFPDLGVHLKVIGGTPRDAADAVLDLIYPPGKGWGFPVIAVLRDEADSDAEAALRAEWEGRGYKVAIASALAGPDDRSGASPQAAFEERLRALDLDPEADLGIVVLSPRQLLDWGLGYEAVDLAVVPAGEAGSNLARRARRILERAARNRVLALDDPDLARRSYEALALGRKLRSPKGLIEPAKVVPAKGPKGKAAAPKALPKAAIQHPVKAAPLQPRSDGDVRRARSGRLRAEEPRLFKAGNIHARRPVIELPIIGGAEIVVPATLAQMVSAILPPLSGRVPEFGGWRRVTTSTEPVPVAALVEVLAVAVQRYAGWPVRFCSWQPSQTGGGLSPVGRVPSAPPAQPARDPGLAVFEIATPTTGRIASRVALALVSALLDGESPDELQAMLLQHMHQLRQETVHERPHVDGLEIAREATLRGISWSVVEGSNILRLGLGRFAQLVAGSETSRSLSIGIKLSAAKHVTAGILANAGLPVPRQRVVRSEEEALDAARAIGFPLVVKPAASHKGRAVSVDVADESGTLLAFRRTQAISPEAIIESFVPGHEYRILVVGGRFAAATHRRPAQVRGDGASTIRALIERENARPERDRRLAGRATSLVPIALDEEALALLTEQGLTPDAVPEPGAMVLLRRQSNHALGGDTVDATDDVHPSVRAMAERAATVLGLDVCGIDFITTDIGKPAQETGAAICEVNTRPGLKLHYGVSEGKARNVAGNVLDMLFPKGTPSRCPVVVLVGTDAETDRLLQLAEKAADRAGRILGVVTEPGKAGNLAPATRHLGDVAAIGWNKEVDAILVRASARDVAERGLGLDRIDLAILKAPEGDATLAAARTALARLSGNRVLRPDDPAARKRMMAALGLPKAGKAGKARAETLPAPAEAERQPAPRPAVAADPVAPPPPGVTPRRSSANATVLMVGDIGFGEPYLHLPRAAGLLRLLDEQGYGYSLAGLQGLLSSADLVIGNLEVPLSSHPDTALRGRKKNLGWSNPDRTVTALSQAGIGALSLANNHSLDCGASGLAETIARLKEAGIASFGAGPDLAAADQPLIRRFTVGGQERSLVVFGGFEHRDRYESRFRWYARPQAPGVSQPSPERIATSIAVLRDCLPAPIFVAYPHWGEHYADVNNAQREQAAGLIEAGVDLIVGHGTHAAQAVEMVAGRPVVFGLGNFIWNAPGHYSKFGARPYSLVAAIVFHGKKGGNGTSLRLFPIMTDNTLTNFQSRPVTEKELADALAVMGQGVGTQFVRQSAKTGSYLEIRLDDPVRSGASDRTKGKVPALQEG